MYKGLAMQARALFALVVTCLAAGAAAAGRDLAAANPCIGQKDGSIWPVGGCSPFFQQCWRGKPIKPTQFCSKGLVFNPMAVPVGCSYVGATGTTGCKCSTAYKGDMAKACAVCQANQKEGDYALPGNNRSFVQCSVQGPFIQKCNTGLRWNDKKKNCL